MARRDRALDAVAQYMDELNRRDHARGAAPRFASPHDAFAIAGAVVELASRQIRTGRPANIAELEPVVERLTMGLLSDGRRERRPRRARSRDRRLPPLPAPRRVARAGRAREARVVRGRGVLGAPDPRLRRPRRRACSCSAWRPPRTAPTARGACSPATARVTSCSRRCTARATPTSRRRSRSTTASSCATASSPPRCAARRRPTSRCRARRRRARTGWRASWRCSSTCASCSASARSPGPPR